MKTLMKLSFFVFLATMGVANAKAAETYLVQNLTFRFTAWYQGPTVTNGNTIIYNASTRSIVTKDVIGWLGTATGNNFSNGVLLVVTQLGVTNPATRVIVRVKTPTSTNNVDVSGFFDRTGDEVTVDNISHNTINGAVNGTFYGYWGFALHDSSNTNYSPLPAHFRAAGFGIDSLTAIVDSSKQVIGEADQGTVANAAGTGDRNGNSFVVEGKINIIGKVVEVDSTPAD
jgi:hypothetical protein